MRQIVLDTETTGLEPSDGHRIIEIGAIELIDRRRTGRKLHLYINPDRRVDDGAIEVHGLTNEFLADKPRFVEIVEEFNDFVRGAELVIHNAEFDIGFLDHELSLLDGQYGQMTDHCDVLDTLTLARAMHPGMRNSLDALCKRYDVDNSRRNLHGALLDSELLAEVYLMMTGGQTALSLTSKASDMHAQDEHLEETEIKLVVVRADDQECDQHQQRLDDIEAQSGQCLWRTGPHS